MEGSSCYKPGKCLNSSGEPFETCPITRREQGLHIRRSPELSAESLCVEALQTVARGRSKNAAKDGLDDVWFGIERSVALPGLIVDDFKALLFATALRGIQELQGREGAILGRKKRTIEGETDEQYLLQARILGLHMPVFGARIRGEQPSKQLMTQVHASFGMFLGGFNERYINNIPASNPHMRQKFLSLRTEHEIDMLLSGRLDANYFPHLASPREESSPDAKKNHDRYVIFEGRKIGIQIKNSSTSASNGLVVIRHYDILRAMKREPEHLKRTWTPDEKSEDYVWPSPYEYSQIIKGSRPDPLEALLIAELEQGRLLDPNKRKALRLARAYVTSRIDEVRNSSK